MKVPLSWLKDYVDIDISLIDLAHRLTMAGLEVEEIELVGLPMPQEEQQHEFKIGGLTWEREKFVVAQVDAVMPHPNAERLVLCRVNDGTQEHIVLTGAPSLLPLREAGTLPQPIKVAYAREGARLYDGHQPGQVLMTLKKTKIRGVESSSMACSEKELGISDEHEDIIHLDPDAPIGTALVDYMGDAVLTIIILPNTVRDANILGVAREIAALTGKKLRTPTPLLPMTGPSIKGKVSIKINEPSLNPRFVLGLVQGVTAQPSPYQVQRRLKLAGMRPINSIVDATNYMMLEVGEPLHAFDYDTLVQRTGGKPPTIITRLAKAGEKLKTLDDVERTLDDFTVLVCDTQGALSIAGVMGGAESEVNDHTRNVLLEGASWNFINVRRTVASQKLDSEAAYRFARGVHPELAPLGVRMGLDAIARWSGGVISTGLVDEYPLPVTDPQVSLTSGQVKDMLGIDLSAQDIANFLRSLEFECTVAGDTVTAQTPAHRLDIHEGQIGQADLIEEVARLYGYDRIPATRLADSLPPQRRNLENEWITRIQDILVELGLQEVVTHRLTEPAREARILPPGTTAEEQPYVRLANPIAPERSHMRRSLLASLLEVLEHNSRLAEHLGLFELGRIFLPRSDQLLPDEPLHLAIALSGKRQLAGWQPATMENMDFYDLKGILEALVEALLPGAVFKPAQHPSYHPGKCAALWLGETCLGVLGELHPLVREHYDFGTTAPVLAADLDMSSVLTSTPGLFEARPVPVFPPVLEDIAVVVDEELPAERVVDVIRQGGGDLLVAVRLFDIYRGEQIGAGKKSLAYALTYQAPDHTLNDDEAGKIRQRIIRMLGQDLGAKLRS